MATTHRIRKLPLTLTVTVTREFQVRVAVALILLRCAAWVLGGRLVMNRSDEDLTP